MPKKEESPLQKVSKENGQLKKKVSDSGMILLVRKSRESRSRSVHLTGGPFDLLTGFDKIYG